MATKRKNEQRARAGSVKGQLDRIESVSSCYLSGKIIDLLRQDRSSSSPYGSLPGPNVKSALILVNFKVT